jgi:zinc transporter ZupT
MDGTSVIEVFAGATITALATGLGALPLLFARNAKRHLLGLANAAAAGVMLAASAALYVEGSHESVPRTWLGILLGALFVLVAHRFVSSREGLTVGSLTGGDAVKAILIVGIMTVHSAAEGIGVGSSFGGGEALGLFVTSAIAIHNIPEGLAISLVLVPRGTSVARAAGWSIFSSLPQPLLAVPAFLFVEEFRAVLPVGLGFAAGAMLWMVVRELAPEALHTARHRDVLLVGAVAFVAMLAFQAFVL